jgi:hypothetical protein
VSQPNCSLETALPVIPTEPTITAEGSGGDTELRIVVRVMDSTGAVTETEAQVWVGAPADQLQRSMDFAFHHYLSQRPSRVLLESWLARFVLWPTDFRQNLQFPPIFFLKKICVFYFFFDLQRID